MFNPVYFVIALAFFLTQVGHALPQVAPGDGSSTMAPAPLSSADSPSPLSSADPPSPLSSADPPSPLSSADPPSPSTSMAIVTPAMVPPSSLDPSSASRSPASSSPMPPASSPVSSRPPTVSPVSSRPPTVSPVSSRPPPPPSSVAPVSSRPVTTSSPPRPAVPTPSPLRVTFDTTFDNKAGSLNSVACSNGANGLTARFGTFGNIPSFPVIGGAFDVVWNSPNCGSCWNITNRATGRWINMTAIDTAGAGFNIAQEAFRFLNGGNIGQGVIDGSAVTATKIHPSVCGL